MAKIVDQYGQPLDSGALQEPQTSRIAALENQYLTPMLAGLSPTRLAGILKAADEGELLNQHRLFADMEERDAHILCEMNKRKLAVMDLDWDIVPPRNASAKEKADAEWLKDVLTDAVDPLEDLLLALMDGVGHGFAAVELAWRHEGKEMLPAFHPRPQEWFRLDRLRRELRLQDNQADGAPLQPFGWALHTHGKAKTGYLGRMGLYRALVWPFLYKAYSLGDFAEFLETYGLPVVVGKYYQGATDAEKASLLRAVTALGHDARAIMPADMQLEIQKVTADGSGTPHLAMVSWCEGAQSKAILGQTLSAEAKATGLGSGNAALHAEVRRDIRNADARQIAGTVTRDLLYPLLALNKGADGLARCPRLVFDTGEAEDLLALAEGVEKLVAAGMRTIPVAWVHERGRIPQPAEGEAVLGSALSPTPLPQAGEGLKPPPALLPSPARGRGAGGEGDAAALAALAAGGTPALPAKLEPDRFSDPLAAGGTPALPVADPITPLAKRLAQEAAPAIAGWLAQIRAMLDTATSLEEFEARLLAAYGELPADDLVAHLATGLSVAELAGRAEVHDGN